MLQEERRSNLSQDLEVRISLIPVDITCITLASLFPVLPIYTLPPVRQLNTLTHTCIRTIMTTKKEVLEKTQTGIEYKLQGNEAFQNKDFPIALKSYHLAVLNLNGLDRSVITQAQAQNGNSGVDEQEIKQLVHQANLELSVVYSNMAAVHLKRENWIRAIACADDALKKNPDNAKASFRKASALKSSGSIVKARNLLETLDKSDPSVNQLITQIQASEKAQDVKFNQSFKGMFDRKPASRSNPVE
ncbi:FKBP-type peptidyl-prolyl cis-trans isomerase [Phaffia rhodozyma]|uniref:FKBP-type peptidyl-prolyl cis-trans isomerase n=1 Tax=Phaffia rhodozyma TaxID=264483 RepID=A0A0F7SVN6_PHARH|nr:FKBP-type peptidyl-prolyl cis-trans isomerase [Phaffia rhodozyma]